MMVAKGYELNDKTAWDRLFLEGGLWGEETGRRIEEEKLQAKSSRRDTDIFRYIIV